ncbi:MAG: YbjP/YqhG family protein [Tannerellaceae bacterium]|jgi:hypothetical protein|nr:YbjP/YqhG family protein [Tannerellaceae bacterium]
MKTNNLGYLLAVFAIAFQFCAQNPGSKVSAATESADGNEKAVRLLKEFYTAYISCCDSPDGDWETLRSIRNKYLTKSLQDKLEHPDLDYDPIIQAQDCDKSWIETLEIKPDAERQNVYDVYYAPALNQKKICIRLLLANDNGNYLIADVLNDANIHDLQAL